MLFDHLLVMSVLTIITFVVILLLDDNWKITLPLTMVNMLFIIPIVYGFWNVEWFYVAIWNETAELHSSSDYKIYSYVFVGFWFIHLLLIVRSGYYAWKESLETKGQMDYNKLKKY